MSKQVEIAWMENNDQHLVATIAWIRLRLERLAISPANTADPIATDQTTSTSHRWFKRRKTPENKRLPAQCATPSEDDIELARQEMVKRENHDSPPALIRLADLLGLSMFDRQVLMLCAAMELDTRIAMLCAAAQGDANKAYPTFALAFILFDDPDWNVLAPYAPLRHWRLLEINQPGTLPLTQASLGIDERIINYLKGLNYLDDRLTPLLDPIDLDSHQQVDNDLPPSQQQIVDSIVQRIKQANGVERLPIIELLGQDANSKQLLANRVATILQVNVQTINLKTLPNQLGDFETFTRLWQRESLLMPLALYIEIDFVENIEKTSLRRFLEHSGSLIFLGLEYGRIETIRHRFSIEVDKPVPHEQEQLWTKALQSQGGDQPQRLAEQFSFTSTEIKRLSNLILSKSSPDQSAFNKALWQACRTLARAGMEQLAQRIEVKANWEKLVLPAEQHALLRQMTDQVAQRSRVYEDWGFREQMNRGLGINALFTGESGTGKTMAAEVIANALQLDLYRIDLSSVVSKYIGETEKNLRKLFDTAEDSGAILFFDEADALFGKRGEVKDSHDRYANIEINYLLQRMESYRGLAILATNMKSALDKAFMRRLRFIVDFPFPQAEQRKQIWQKVFPSSTPLDKALDYDRLAKLNLTGGSILNIALNAAFLAAQEGKMVTMPLLLNAARTEFKKLDRPVKESDFRWQGHIGVVK